MKETIELRVPVAADASIGLLELVGTDAAGDAVPFAGTSGQSFLGYSTSPANNTGGVAGGKKVAVSSGLEEIDIAPGITPKPGQNAYVETSTSVTNVAPVADAEARSVGIFVAPSQIHATKWSVDFRPAYFRHRVTVA